MLPASRRYLLIMGLLLGAVVFAWSQHWFLTPRAPEVPLQPEVTTIPGTARPGASGTPGPAYTYFVDVEGWYRITPYETVVRSAYDLSGDANQALTEALPPSVGEWKQVGEDVYLNNDPAIIEFLGHPPVALSRTYQDSAGHYLTLSLLGNSGDDSFLLFSHTPETCLPGRLWQISAKGRVPVPIDDRSMYVQYLLTEYPGTDQRQIALYWYLWDRPERDSRAGVLSMRVYVLVSPEESKDTALDRAEGFIRALFPATIDWSRF